MVVLSLAACVGKEDAVDMDGVGTGEIALDDELGDELTSIVNDEGD